MNHLDFVNSTNLGNVSSRRIGKLEKILRDEMISRRIPRSDKRRQPKCFCSNSEIDPMPHPSAISRRGFLCTSLAGAAALAGSDRCLANAKLDPIGLGFSLYGMRSLSLADALKACAEIGYDSVELPVMPDWPADSAELDAAARRDLGAALSDAGLRLTALMENLPCHDASRHDANLERLRRACDLAHDLAPPAAAGEAVPPLVETILGGKPGEFSELKGALVELLADWAEILATKRVRLAIKAHFGNAIQSPAQLLEVLDAVASPWVVAAYDYSHFQLQGLAMAESMSQLLPRSAFVHVKDARQSGEKWQFVLPGEGTIDYAEYFRLLSASGYRGDAVVEVSGQVFSQPGYDPVAAARKCYNHLAPAMKSVPGF
jgi:sugar phosphate isomerase/epimerase